MSFTLDTIVPWGRSFDEYVAMFALTNNDLQKHILGCGDGPAAFNATLTAQGGRVTSIDPLYQCSAHDIRQRINETYDTVLAQTRNNQHEFVWKSIHSVEELGQIRLAAMNDFLADYERGKQQARYLAHELPQLPFANQQFDLAICSHLLFLYSEQLSLAFHFEAILELCRVANEVRIFPLLELGAKPSRHLQTVADMLEKQGYNIIVRKVNYEFQRGGNQMMQIEKIA